MQNVLITGGSGTVGEAFLRRYSSVYRFGIMSRNEKLQYEIKKKFPLTYLYLASVEDKEALFRTYDSFQPDIVIHAAAMKHVDMAERQPIQTTHINVIGSLNVIDASVRFDVPATIAISTDKACERQHTYGITKYLMEQCFMEANGNTNHFAVCRFGNVAHSNGSVIPFWLKEKAEGKSLKLTSPNMNRLMFLPPEAADLIHRTIFRCFQDGGFVMSSPMKTINMLRLANAISENIEIVGIRPGEKLDEDLISERELPFTTVLSDGSIIIGKQKNEDENTRLKMPYNTKTAENMSAEELKNLVSWTA